MSLWINHSNWLLVPHLPFPGVQCCFRLAIKTGAAQTAWLFFHSRFNYKLFVSNAIIRGSWSHTATVNDDSIKDNFKNIHIIPTLHVFVSLYLPLLKKHEELPPELHSQPPSGSNDNTIFCVPHQLTHLYFHSSSPCKWPLPPSLAPKWRKQLRRPLDL